MQSAMAGGEQVLAAGQRARGSRCARRRLMPPIAGEVRLDQVSFRYKA
jgi:hypothetical protein